MAVLEVADQDFDTKILKSEKAVMVDFFATWCGPCKLAEPVLEELSGAQDKVVVAKLDVDKSPNTPQKYGVLSIPTTILFKGGQEVGRQVGFAGRKPFEDLIAKAGGENYGR